MYTLANDSRETIVEFEIDFEAEEAMEAARNRGLSTRAVGTWDDGECGVWVHGHPHQVSDWEYYDCA